MLQVLDCLSLLNNIVLLYISYHQHILQFNQWEFQRSVLNLFKTDNGNFLNHQAIVSKYK